MMRKLCITVVCLILTIIIIPQTNTVVAGDEENPEIEDKMGDVPFQCIDIVSAWFFEDPDDPDYLYAAIKIRDLQYKWIFTGYVIYWFYNSSLYSAYLSTWGNGSYFLYNVIENGVLLQQIAGSCDLEHDIIAMKIPKIIIGDPNPGDVLLNPYVFTIYSLFGSIFGPFSPLSDYAPNNLQGNNYTIQY